MQILDWWCSSCRLHRLNFLLNCRMFSLAFIARHKGSLKELVIRNCTVLSVLLFLRIFSLLLKDQDILFYYQSKFVVSMRGYSPLAQNWIFRASHARARDFFKTVDKFKILKDRLVSGCELKYLNLLPTPVIVIDFWYP